MWLFIPVDNSFHLWFYILVYRIDIQTFVGLFLGMMHVFLLGCCTDTYLHFTLFVYLSILFTFACTSNPVWFLFLLFLR